MTVGVMIGLIRIRSYHYSEIENIEIIIYSTHPPSLVLRGCIDASKGLGPVVGLSVNHRDIDRRTSGPAKLEGKGKAIYIPRCLLTPPTQGKRLMRERADHYMIGVVDEGHKTTCRRASE